MLKSAAPGNKLYIVFPNSITITRPVYDGKHKQVRQQLARHSTVICVFGDFLHCANTIWSAGFFKAKVLWSFGLRQSTETNGSAVMWEAKEEHISEPYLWLQTTRKQVMCFLLQGGLRVFAVKRELEVKLFCLEADVYFLD